MKNFNKGFTIIELIVVIAIIAVLAAIITSSTVVYINRAKDTAVKANVSQVAKSMQSYYADHGDLVGYAMPTSLGADYGSNINTSTGAFVVYAKLTSSNYFAIDSTGATGTLTNPPDINVYTVAEGSGAACTQNSDCTGVGSCYCSNNRCVSCSEGQTCSNNTCVGSGSCQGTCSGCGDKGSNDEYMCYTYGGDYCCSNYSGCSWNSGNNSCDNNTCSGDANICGGSCPSGCYWE